MQVVAVPNAMTVPVENGRSATTLDAGTEYVLHDVEVDGGRQAGVFELIRDLPPRPSRADLETEPAGRLILPFIGGLSEAVAMLPVVAEIRRRCPRLQIDVAATPGPGQVFALSPCVDDVIAYPVDAERWGRYDHYLTLEDIEAHAGRARANVFAGALGLDLPPQPRFRLNLPRALDAVDERSAVPLIGIAAGEGREAQSYPLPMVRELVADLVGRGSGCVLLGHDDPTWTLPVCPPVITDMRSRTPTVLELAVWLRAVDLVVSHDSFIMHLAGALGCPTVALFSPTSRVHAAPYPNTSVVSGADWQDPAVAPVAVSNAVMARLETLDRLMPPGESRRVA